MNISYFVPSLRRKGPSYQLFYLLTELSKKNSILLVVLRDDPRDSLLASFSNISNIVIIDLNSTISYEFLSFNHKFNSLIIEFNIDLIHTQGLQTDFLTSFFKVKGKKYLCTLRNDPFVDYKDKFGSLFGYFIACLHIFSVSRISNIVCCSYYLNHQWSLYLKKNYFVVHNSVDLKRFEFIPEVSNSDEKILELLQNENTYTYVGSLIKRKNISFLINVFKELKEQNYQLVIIGSGPLLQKLKKMSTDNIHFLGHIPSPERLLRYSRFFISASLSEGLPNSVLEAMALNVPVILSDIPPHLEIFSGFEYDQFFNVECEKSLIDLLLSHKSIDPKKLVIQFKELINGKFISSIAASKYQKIYTEI